MLLTASGVAGTGLFAVPRTVEQSRISTGRGAGRDHLSRPHAHCRSIDPSIHRPIVRPHCSQAGGSGSPAVGRPEARHRGKLGHGRVGGDGFLEDGTVCDDVELHRVLLLRRPVDVCHLP